MGGIIYAGTNTAGVFMSADTGATWKAVNNGLPTASIRSIAIQSNRILASTKDKVLFISADSGEHWEFLASSKPTYIVCNDTAIYKSWGYTYDRYISESTDSFKTSVDFYEAPVFALWAGQCDYTFSPEITALTICNGKVFVGMNCGIIHRMDSHFPEGLEWIAPIPDSLDVAQYFLSLAFHNKRLYAGTWNGLLLSVDSGYSWQKISSTSPPLSIVSIAVHDSAIAVISNGIGYIGGSDTAFEYGMVYRSRDGGKTWTALDSVFTASKVSSLVFCDNNLFAATEGKLLRSTDFGDSWSVTDSGLKGANIKVLAVNNATVYACGDSGIFQSSDHGKSWSIKNKSKGISDLVVTDTCMYALHNKTVYRYDAKLDGWISLTRSSDGNPRDPYSIAVIGNELLIGNAYSGLVRSSTSFRSSSFSAVNSGISWGEPHETAATYDFMVCDNTLYAATQNGVYRTNGNQGDLGLSSSPTWTSINEGLPSDVYSLTSRKTDIFASSRSQGIFVWNSSDSMWNPTNNGLTNLSISEIITSGDNILAATGNGIFYSNESWGPWTRSTGIPDSTAITRLASCGSRAVATSSTDNAYRSVNNGISWEPISKFTDKSIRSLAMIDTVIFAGTSEGVFRSTDNGKLWEIANSGISNLAIHSLLAVDSVLLAGTSSNIFLSKNYGESWTVTIGTGFSGTAYTAMAVNNGYLYVSNAFTGIYLVNFPDFLPIKNSLMIINTLTTDVRILKHTSNSVIFSLAIPHDEQVRLSVYDVQGRLIATPVNAHLPAGKHRITWPARTNARGFYLLKMQAGKKQIVRKFQMF